MSEALASPFSMTRLLETIRPPRLGSVALSNRSGRPDGTTVAVARVKDSVSLEALVERLQKGDDSALEAFIEATSTMAHRLAFSILNDRDRCQDVLQEVYLTVYQKIGQLQTPAALRGWFSQILINRCRQELRGRKFDQSLDELPDSNALFGVDGMADQVDTRIDVQAAMQTLPTDDREVLNLREVLDLSYQEIAESLQVPLGTVRSRIFNARQRLLAALTGKRSSR